MTAVGQPLELVEQPDRVPGARELIIEVKTPGLCHSDVSLLTAQFAGYGTTTATAIDALRPSGRMVQIGRILPMAFKSVMAAKRAGIAVVATQNAIIAGQDFGKPTSSSTISPGRAVSPLIPAFVS